MLDGDRDGVRAFQGIDPKHVLEVGDHELLEQLHVRLYGIHAKVFHVGGESFIKPKIRPPTEEMRRRDR